jgi:hypothetical protein
VLLRSVRYLTVAVLFCAPLMAQTVVTESQIIGPDGGLASGTVRVWPSQSFETPGGVRVSTVQSVVRIVNGQFSIALWPNDTSIPGNTYYYARWQLDGAAPELQLWYIPTCAEPFDVAQVQASISIVGGVTTVSAGGAVCPPYLVWNQETETWNLTSGTWASQ